MIRRLINVQDMAAYIGTTPGVIYQMVSQKTIPYVKIGRSTRFDMQKVDAWIEKNSRGVHGSSLLAQ